MKNVARDGARGGKINFQCVAASFLCGGAPNPYVQSSGVMDIMSHLSDMLTFTTETQSVKQVPYDASSFDIPAGDTQTEGGGATPPPILQ